ncbi:MAG: carboxypeptidase regulatory-like domain-containing protein [bacterium]|nr:carboxypeptidase regulatory-like domain-containing protein [bacterium]
MVLHFRTLVMGVGLSVLVLAGLAGWRLGGETQRSKAFEPLHKQAASTGVQVAEPLSEFQEPLDAAVGHRLLAGTTSESDARTDLTPITKFGSIAGRVELLTGEPLKDVLVVATPEIPNAGIFPFPPGARTGEHGLFRLPKLAVGSYVLHVRPRAKEAAQWALPIRGENTYETGQESVVLAVDALIVRVETKVQKGAFNLPWAIQCTRIDAGDVVDGGSDYQEECTTHESGNEVYDKALGDFMDLAYESIDSDDPPLPHDVPGQWISHAQFILPTTSTFLFQSDASLFLEGPAHSTPSDFYGTLKAGHASGSMTLQISRTPSTLGTIVLRIDQFELPDGARLKVSSMTHNGCRYAPKCDDSTLSKFGRAQLTLSGLMPGEYTLHLTLSGTEKFILIDKDVQITLTAGSTADRNLTTSEWGTMKIKVISSGPVEPRTSAEIAVKKPGSVAWQHLPMPYSGGGAVGIRYIPRTLITVGAPPKLSSPMEPGEYVLRVTLPGHATLEQTVHVELGANDLVTLELHPE